MTRARLATLGVGLGAAALALAAAMIGPSPSVGGGSPRASIGDGAMAAVPSDATLRTPSSTVAASIPHPTATAPSPTASPSVARPGVFGGILLIADRGNGRLLAVDPRGRVVWRFPAAGSLPPGQRFSADDAFIAPDGRSIVANDESHQVIDRIDIASRKVIWQYGRYDRSGSAPGFLHTPDDAYPLANGDIVVADIRNCRILQVDPAKHIVRAWGHAGRCAHRPPASLDEPNGDTPLPDGGLLVTEITGSRVIRLSASGRVVFDIHAPVRYPSDAQLDPSGDVIVVDYANPGAVLRLSPSGRTLWRYGPTSGPGRLDHPSLALPLPNGLIVLNDDDRHRVIVLDPRTNRIVWQYGRTDRPSTHTGSLNVPDGIDVVPLGVFPGT